jgi:hypothetical protein
VAEDGCDFIDGACSYPWHSACPVSMKQGYLPERWCQTPSQPRPAMPAAAGLAAPPALAYHRMHMTGCTSIFQRGQKLKLVNAVRPHPFWYCHTGVCGHTRSDTPANAVTIVCAPQQGAGSASDTQAQLVEPTVALDAAISRRDTSQIAALLSDDVVIHHGEPLPFGTSCVAFFNCTMRRHFAPGNAVL